MAAYASIFSNYTRSAQAGTLTHARPFQDVKPLLGALLLRLLFDEFL